MHRSGVVPTSVSIQDLLHSFTIYKLKFMFLDVLSHVSQINPYKLASGCELITTVFYRRLKLYSLNMYYKCPFKELLST